MIKVDDNPSTRRVALAFLMAPAAGALAYGSMVLWPDLLVVQALWLAAVAAILYGYPAAIVIGVPVYVALEHRLRPTLLNCALVGAAIAAIPWALFGLLASAPDYSFSNGHVTSNDGSWTVWGWLDAGMFVAQTAAAGFVTGAVFWVVATCRIRPSRQGEAPTPSP